MQTRAFFVFGLSAAGFFSCVSIAKANPVIDVMQATTKLANRKSNGTCLLVRINKDGREDRIVAVTAAHVLQQMTGPTCQLIVREKRTDGSYVRKEQTLAIRSGDKPLWVQHARHDAAAIEIPPAIARSIGHTVALDQIPRNVNDLTDFNAASEVWMPGYPAQLESTPAGFSVLRRGTVASFPLTPESKYPRYLVDYSVVRGDSGGPVVFVEKDPNGQDRTARIVGVISGQHREREQLNSLFEQKTVHRYMGLGIVVHAQFIREIIDQLNKGT